MAKNSAAPVQQFWVVYDHCLCEDPSCYGKTELALFDNEQTARQEADIRSQRWGGSSNRPDMHIEKVVLSRKTSASR